jgi:hypothetical protein
MAEKTRVITPLRAAKRTTARMPNAPTEADGIQHRHAASQHHAGNNEESAADAEEPGEEAGDKADRDEPHRNPAVDADTRVALADSTAQHRDAHHDHHERDDEEKTLPVDRLTDGGADEGADDAGDTENDCTGPLHRAGAGVLGEIGEGVQRHRERTGPDRHVRIAHANHV